MTSMLPPTRLAPSRSSSLRDAVFVSSTSAVTSVLPRSCKTPNARVRSAGVELGIKSLRVEVSWVPAPPRGTRHILAQGDIEEPHGIFVGIDGGNDHEAVRYAGIQPGDLRSVGTT
jgi:hypothetical protein